MRNQKVPHFIAIILVLFILITLIFACGSGVPNYKLENPNWFLNDLPAPSSATLEKLVDSVIPTTKPRNSHIRLDTTGVWEFDTVGIWQGRTVIDIYYIVQKPSWEFPEELKPFEEIKAIAIETSKDKYRLVYSIYSQQADTYFRPSKIKYIDGDSVLNTDSPMSGSGGYRDDRTWYWDKKNQIPRLELPQGFTGDKGPPSIRNTIRWLYLDTHMNIYWPALAPLPADTIVNYFARVSISGTMSSNWKTIPFTWRMDTLGTLHGYNIVKIDFFVNCEDCDDPDGKVIAVELEPERYRMLYFEKTRVNLTPGENTLIVFEDDTLLGVQGNSSRIGRFENNYWIWSSEENIPVSLYREWVLNETLNLYASPMLPEGVLMNPKLQHWDFHKLRYEVSLYSKNDEGKPVDEGILSIRFGIKDEQMVPVEIVYERKSEKN